jgi:hypothetical protein
MYALIRVPPYLCVRVLLLLENLIYSLSLLVSVQLESALKAAEIAQASMQAERANSRTLIFSEEEIKSLQLQVMFHSI